MRIEEEYSVLGLHEVNQTTLPMDQAIVSAESNTQDKLKVGFNHNTARSVVCGLLITTYLLGLYMRGRHNFLRRI